MKIIITADPMIPVPPVHYGGIERIIFMLIEELAERGHEVTLIAHRDSKVPCELIAYPGETQSRKDVLKNTALVTSVIYRRRFDVLHSFGRLAYLTLTFPLGIRKIMSYQREPTISQVKLAMRLAKKGSMLFTGCSEYIAAKMRPYAPSYAVHNFVDTDKYTFTQTVDDDAPLAFLGRIEHIKGTHIAIDMAQRSGRKLIIAGNVPKEKEHQEYFDQQIKPRIDGDRIRYIGPVDDLQKNDLLGQAAAFLMPILWEEPFGIVMAEALACGTPVIGFRRGAVPEIVDHGENGFMCDETEEMLRLIGRIPGLSRAACRLSAEQRFSKPVITDQYLALYQAQ
jgi:glycosyltransferase involved in cell wall biosynthesis